MRPSLTLFFIVEPPKYESLACYLAASIRQHLDPDIALVGYCPAQRMDEIAPAVVETLRRLRCELRPMETGGAFDPPYPHGNKILACQQPRDTEWSGFMDSDILVLRPHDITRFLGAGHVACSVAASIRWKPDHLWETAYSAFGLSVPEERITLMRQKKPHVPPYYSSGLVLFPEAPSKGSGRTFAETWLDTARTLDRVPELEDFRRPYLDQISLPVAIRRAGLSWLEIPEADHFILGGRLRGKPLGTRADLTAVHYRKWKVLTEAGLAKAGFDALAAQAGTKRVHRIFGAEPPLGAAAADVNAAD